MAPVQPSEALETHPTKEAWGTLPTPQGTPRHQEGAALHPNLASDPVQVIGYQGNVSDIAVESVHGGASDIEMDKPAAEDTAQKAPEPAPAQGEAEQSLPDEGVLAEEEEPEASKAVSLFDSGSDLPRCHFIFRQKDLKGEDQALASTPLPLPGMKGPKFQVFAVFDGHSSRKTSVYCKKHLMDELYPRMPTVAMPPECEPESFEAYLRQIRHAVTESFLALNKKTIAAKLDSGCTASVVIATGWMLTVANVGDSSVVVETSKGYRIVSADHRLEDNEDEAERLRQSGYLIARLRADFEGPVEEGEPGFGPLRVWPGGVNMSRAIGDQIAGEGVLAYPYVIQIRVPTDGLRLIIASDGLWDSKLKVEQVCRMMRRRRLRKAAADILKSCIRLSGLQDDTTLLVADILPWSKRDYAEVWQPGPHPQPPCACLRRAPGPSGKEATHVFGILNSTETVPQHLLHKGAPSRLVSGSPVDAMVRPQQPSKLWRGPSFQNLKVYRKAASLKLPPDAGADDLPPRQGMSESSAQHPYKNPEKEQLVAGL
uniref:Protein phosphatase 2c 15 n=1 Tax=Tetraselmis sp. GSL018 TaxID=582737 RepID=A0A061S795_9CHLO|mmetsp:Transcript_9849/g.23534  ORF Transcript_9849/g.23534 Transcript_9849/m.23534 type:complete len:542 (+) Transcript_9849:802-2427(+)